MSYSRRLLLLVCFVSSGSRTAARQLPDPYARQVAEQTAILNSTSENARAGAVEALGFLRAYSAEQRLIEHLADSCPVVRRQAAMSLGWCGSRNAVNPLLDALDAADAMTRQGAYVALTNLTGMELPFDSMAPESQRTAQIKAWRRWWATVRPGRVPQEVLRLIEGFADRRISGSVTVSSTYKGPPDVLTDGLIGPGFWQTKNVPFPQWCTVDLGQPQMISRVTIHQYGPQFVMTDYELATSLDNRTFKTVERKKGKTAVTLVSTFRPRLARYVRLSSHASANLTYPTTLFEIQIGSGTDAQSPSDESVIWRCERGVRALGALGGAGATQVIIRCLGPIPPLGTECLPLGRAGIRSLGRLQHEAGFSYLMELLDNTYWARYAADALGDFGDRRAIPALVTAYRRYCKKLDGSDPRDLPRDDKMTFPSEDRMLETPYHVAFALCRLLSDSPSDRAAVREIAPLIMANLPGDHDTFFLYEPEGGHLLTRHLLELSGLRQQACEHAFDLLGQPRRAPKPQQARQWPEFYPGRMATWLPAVCADKDDLSRLIALLSHEDGWVRLNAAKTLAWIGDKRAIEPIATILAKAKSEADYGYSGTFKDEEYADPAPRWREGLIRALGLLGAHDHTGLIVRILEDEGSVMEIRHAAAQALTDLGNPMALRALQRASQYHPFHSTRVFARDALCTLANMPAITGTYDESNTIPEDISGDSGFEAVVFIKGENNIPNTIGTVEQADRWRQTYVVTDSGPAYRPGRNLHTLRPVRPDGAVTPLTRFEDGYVAEPELSWDGRHVIFSYRTQKNPWWHVYRINIDGSGLRQLTRGPYHDVGPAYLPDGRIVFTSSRAGIRDEYHGYPCTSLHVMNPDGSDIHTIATNIGRDNEPAVLLDGRIVFSRLEVFYSRNKTELTLHAANPDGTRDMVLYGPERRVFWRDLDHGPRTPADGQEAPLTHRVLRMTQPQPMPDGQNIVVVTQGGLALVGPSRYSEQIITPDNKTRSYTTPFPLPDGRILCASTLKTPDREKVDLGLYVFDPESKHLELLYNDPAAADFEARPIFARSRPPVLASRQRHQGYSGNFVCASVFTSQQEHVARRGRYIRLIEGIPVFARHSTQTNEHEVWKNHGGTLARVLGTAPLAPDGSFFIEVPADRLLQFQVLDSNRRVLGNQLTWMYTRADETKSCVGCHEIPNTAPPSPAPIRLARRNQIYWRQSRIGAGPMAMRLGPLDFLPKGDEFRYRAKAWFKGSLPPEIEHRTRTVRAVNLLAR
ncbi:MAG: HEAT repeat domain-containing protein [Phycisphaerales bacterium]|nr:MAG: HEAT repeat domain-containing protein [Phycisphaerales bacterium]